MREAGSFRDIIGAERTCVPNILVYYESIKREPKIRGIYECRCDERGSLSVVRIPSHITVFLTGSPLEEGCSLILFWIGNKNTWESHSFLAALLLSTARKLGNWEASFVMEGTHILYVRNSAGTTVPCWRYYPLSISYVIGLTAEGK